MVDSHTVPCTLHQRSVVCASFVFSAAFKDSDEFYHNPDSPLNKQETDQRTLDLHFVPIFPRHSGSFTNTKTLHSSAAEMADSDQPVNAPTSPRGSDTFHRDHRRGAPGQGIHVAQNGSVRGASLRGGRTDRGTRGRGQSNHSKTTHSNGALILNGGRPPDLSSDATNGVVASTGGRLGQDKESKETSSRTPNNSVEKSSDGDVCFICASTIEHTSIAPCNHQTCHICSLRMRALYKNRTCAHCRVSNYL